MTLQKRILLYLFSVPYSSIHSLVDMVGDENAIQTRRKEKKQVCFILVDSTCMLLNWCWNYFS